MIIEIECDFDAGMQGTYNEDLDTTFSVSSERVQDDDGFRTTEFTAKLVSLVFGQSTMDRETVVKYYGYGAVVLAEHAAEKWFKS